MRTILLFILIVTATASSTLSQQNKKASLEITTIATDPKYGYEPTSKYAIKVGNVKNEYAFIQSLAGPNGEQVQAARIGSCCAFKSKKAAFGKGFLDKWEITWPNQDKPLIIYLNSYEFEMPKCPMGLTIAPPSVSRHVPEEDSVVTGIVPIEKKRFLMTGWYGIADRQTPYPRTAHGKSDTIFIDPAPLITIKDFKSLTLRDGTDNERPMLVFKFNDSVSEKWLTATTRYTGLRIGFVLNNKLLQELTVHEPIYGGYAAISGDFSVQELEAIKKEIELGIQNGKGDSRQ